MWSAAAFLDPVKEANRVRQVVLTLAAELANDPLVVTPVLPIPHVIEADDDARSAYPDAVETPDADAVDADSVGVDVAGHGDAADSSGAASHDHSASVSRDTPDHAPTEASFASQSTAPEAPGNEPTSPVDAGAPGSESQSAASGQETLPGLGDSHSAPASRRKRAALPVRPVNQ